MIPDESQSQIMDAIAQFDRDLRDTEGWIGGEEIPSQLYALVVGGTALFCANQATTFL